MSRIAELIRRGGVTADVSVGDSRDSSMHSRKSVHPEDPFQEADIDNALQIGHEGSHHSSIWRLPSRTPSTQDLPQMLHEGSHHSHGSMWRSPSRALSTQLESAEAAEPAQAQSEGSPRHPRTVKWYLATFFGGMRGGLDTRSKPPPLLDMALGWVGAFASILVLSVLNQWATPSTHLQFLVASFGASAVLLFGAPDGKMSQPRSLVGGHVVSALVGCTVRIILRDVVWLSTPFGMAFALLAMNLTCTLHPPGGATGLIAASQPLLERGAGYSIVLVVLVDALIMLAIAVFVNNVRPSRSYPTFWL